MALSTTKIRNAKPRTATYRLYDERGLYLEVAPSGGKWWRFKYRFDNKEKRLSFGVFPDVGLKEAREARDEARKLKASGTDPGVARKLRKLDGHNTLAATFETVARKWFKEFSGQWAESHSKRVLRLLERDIFPWLGARPVSQITSPELLDVLRKIQQRGASETAHRARGNCSMIFRYAIAVGLATRDPSHDLRGALAPAQKGHFAAATEPSRFGEIIRAMADYRGTPPVICALQLMPLIFVRPGELRHAKWTEINFEAAEWRYTVGKTKTPHIVPLCRQALALLKGLEPITGRGQYVFPSARSADRPMSDNAVLAAMRRLGIGKEEMTGHGFRAVARTILDEVLHQRVDHIEHQLAHAVRDANGRAYNRTTHLPERREMLQVWADYLDELKKTVKHG